MHVFFILSSLASRLVSCLAWIFDHGRLLTGTLVLGASLIALYRYGYLGVVFGWAIAAILLVGLVAWAYIARLIKDAIDEFLVFAIPACSSGHRSESAQRSSS